MIYMAGDNNLSTDMAYALEQIKSVTSHTDKINIFVYYDGFSSNVPTMYCDFSEQNVINYYRSFKIKDKLIKREGETDQVNENSASVNNIINFVDWCVNKVEHTVEHTVENKVEKVTVKGRRANRYAMIFSGHSFGFQDQGLFRDEKANYHMTLRKLRWMFERITKKEPELHHIAKIQQMEETENWSPEKYIERTSPILGQKLSILGFDSCVMSMLEIGCQFREIAETMVASEGSIPNAGWSYAQMLLGKIVSSNAEVTNTASVSSANSVEIPNGGALVSDDGDDDVFIQYLPSSKAIAAGFVEAFIIHQNKFSLADISVDMSAWDLTKVGELENALHDMVESILKCFEDENSIAYKQLKRILMQTHWECQTYMFDQNIDLGDFCKLLAAEIESVKTEFQSLDKATYDKEISVLVNLGDLCKKVYEKIIDCIILSGFSGGEYQFSTGISMFFPWSWASYKVSRANYERLTFVQMNKTGKIWNEFLQKYLGKINRRQAKPLSKRDADNNYIKDEDYSVVYKSYFYTDETDQNGSNSNNDNGSKTSLNPTNKNPAEHDLKTSLNPTNKNSAEGDDKTSLNPSNKNPAEHDLKTSLNPSNKISDDGDGRTSLNPTNKTSLNPSNKLLGALNILFSEFTITKNIEAHWNHSGFMSKEIVFMPEKKISEQKAKDEAEFQSKTDAANTAVVNPLASMIVGIPGGSKVSVDIGELGLSSIMVNRNRMLINEKPQEITLFGTGIKNNMLPELNKLVKDIENEDVRNKFENLLSNEGESK